MAQYHVPKSTRAWPWGRFVGDPLALKFACRELQNVHAVVKQCRAHHVAVQAGGNLGLFPKFLAQHFETVITFEPEPQNFKWLQENAPEANIQAYQLALGEQRASIGLSRIRRDGSRGAEHAGIVHVSGSGSVPMIRLDELQLERCDLIMLDIEGYELFALRGAVETITRCRPVIALEVNQNLHFFGLQKSDIDDFFAQQRYALKSVLANDRLYLPAEAPC